MVRKLIDPRAWAAGLFWSWNLIFLAFMLLGFAPQILPIMMTAVRAGEIPAAFLTYAVLLTAIPALAVILGFTLLRDSAGRLFALGYGVEAPLMLLLGVRFFAVRALSPAVALLLTIAAVGMATYLWHLLDRNIDRRGPALTYIRVGGLTLLVLTGLYVGIWLAFYTLPLATAAWQFVSEVIRGEFLRYMLGGSFEWRDLLSIPWRWVPFWVLGIILLMYTATLFLVMPIAVAALYLRAWWRGLQALLARTGLRRTVVLVPATVGIVALLLLVWFNRQPQHRAFTLLETPPSSSAEAQALLEQQEAIRAGLLNAYLAPFRYFSAVGEVRHVRGMYEAQFDISPERAKRIQHWYETVAQPVLYHPVHPVDTDDPTSTAIGQEPLEAATLYEQFFDESILDGEHDAIVGAVRSTWRIDQAQAGWQAIDDREIHLTRQDVTITEHGDWAEIELYEVYRNQTGEQQEAVYYFSLPESAVVTGLWLGNGPERDERFVYQVTPRGAAQALYRNERQIRRDPALIEQIGPRQYRLRVFPIQPQRMQGDDAQHLVVEAGLPLHLWLTYRTLAVDDAWPLPRLAEKRNVYWDTATERHLNGAPMPVDADSWLPASVPASAPVTPTTHRVEFASGERVLVQPIADADVPTQVDDMRLAVVLDRSRSMVVHAAEVESALTQLREAAGDSVDVYLTASPYRGEAPSRMSLTGFSPESVLYFGGQNAAGLLAQYDALRAGQAYDAVLVLTDGSGYELGQSEIAVPRSAAPIWMVHLGGDFPLGYDDATLEAIQASGGGVAGSIEEALTRMHAGSTADVGSGALVDVIDGYVWTTLPAGIEIKRGEALAATDDDFGPFAARRLILAEMYRARGSLDELENLDQLHEIAVEQSIVTPYSSMLVVVEARQQALLNTLTARADRFEREYEPAGETTPQNALTVTGVPEPEEWLLLGLAAVMLVWYMRRQDAEAAHVGK